MSPRARETSRLTAVDGLVERDQHVALLSAAVDRARDGDGGLVLVEGAAGIGKSRLCAEAQSLAEGHDMTVLSARGGEFERDVTYGVVRQLLERLVLGLDPGRRRRLLAGPAALAGAALGAEPDRVRRPAETGIDHGLYWLVSHLAAHEPLALVIDDAHWADASSLRFLVYLARRLDGLGVLVLIAGRTDEPGGASGPLDVLGTEPSAQCLLLEPLSAPGTAALLAVGLGRAPSDAVARACHDVTGGNPFFVGEIAVALREAGDADDQALIALARSLVPRAIKRSILMRLGGQPHRARVTAQTLAVVGDGAAVDVLCAVAGSDPQATTEALVELSRAGIVTRSGAVAFVHPIVRTVIYHDVPEVRRAALHAGAAQALAERGVAAEEIARHLALTEPAGDVSVVATLRAVAARALQRRAAEVAVALLARALREPPAPDERAVVLTELGEAELQAGSVLEAVGHLGQALALDPPCATRVRAAVALGSALMSSAGPERAVAMLTEQAEILDGDAALRIDVERAKLAMWVRGAIAMPWLDTLLTRFATLPGTSTVQRLALIQVAFGVALDPAGDARSASELARHALGGGTLVAELTVDELATGMAAHVLVMAEDFDAAAREIAPMRDDARARGSVLDSVGVAQLVGAMALRRGALALAAAELEAALTAARMLEPSAVVQRCVAFTEACLVEALLARGDAGAARGVVEAAAQHGDLDRPGPVRSRYARGLLRLLEDGDPAGAVEDFLAFGEAARAGVSEERCTPWRQWAARALAATQRHEEAVALADEQLAIARAWGAPGGHGSALQVRALVGPPAQAEPLLAEAVELLTRAHCRVDLARAHVDHGIALRRAGRRRDARAALEQGLELAARCEAAPLVTRARAELRVLGARPRRRMFSGVEGLTASEHRVAGMAAEGLTNADIAQALFVTRKTIETHLHSVFRKLGISSRRELAAALEPRTADA